jgi:hypothetical protein
MNPDMMKDVEKVCEMIQKKLPLSGLTHLDTLVSVLEKVGSNRPVIERSIYLMVQRGDLEFKHQRNYLVRKR